MNSLETAGLTPVGLKRVGRDILIFPLTSTPKQLFATWGHLVVVGTLVLAAFLDESVVDQLVEIR